MFRSLGLLLLALVSIAFASKLDLLPKKKTGPADPGCCMLSASWQADVMETTASWDMNEHLAGSSFIEMQVDTKEHMAHAFIRKLNPSGLPENFDAWLGPGHDPNTWFQYMRPMGSAVCYVVALDVMPNILNPLCYRAPLAEYTGDVQLGSHWSQVWSFSFPRANSSAVIDPSLCLPQVVVAEGWSDHSDFYERESTFMNFVFSVDPDRLVPPTGCRPLPPGDEMIKHYVPQVFRM